MALDYDWDHNNTGYSESSCSTCGPTVDRNSKKTFLSPFFSKTNVGMVYFTVASEGSSAGAIKRAYIPSVDDGSNNIAASVPLDIDYITTPDGIAVDWVGRCVADTQLYRLARLCSFCLLESAELHHLQNVKRFFSVFIHLPTAEIYTGQTPNCRGWKLPY